MECWVLRMGGWVARGEARYPIDYIATFLDSSINRHCERSEAIHRPSALAQILHPEVRALARLEGRRPDCGRFILRGSLRSHLMMTGKHSRSRGMFCPSFAGIFVAPKIQRAQGMPDARCTRGLMRGLPEKGCA